MKSIDNEEGDEDLEQKTKAERYVRSKMPLKAYKMQDNFGSADSLLIKTQKQISDPGRSSLVLRTQISNQAKGPGRKLGGFGSLSSKSGASEAASSTPGFRRSLESGLTSSVGNKAIKGRTVKSLSDNTSVSASSVSSAERLRLAVSPEADQTQAMKLPQKHFLKMPFPKAGLTVGSSSDDMKEDSEPGITGKVVAQAAARMFGEKSGMDSPKRHFLKKIFIKIAPVPSVKATQSPRPGVTFPMVPVPSAPVRRPPRPGLVVPIAPVSSSPVVQPSRSRSTEPVVSRDVQSRMVEVMPTTPISFTKLQSKADGGKSIMIPSKSAFKADGPPGDDDAGFEADIEKSRGSLDSIKAKPPKKHLPKKHLPKRPLPKLKRKDRSDRPPSPGGPPPVGPATESKATKSEKCSYFLTSARFLLVLINVVFLVGGIATIWLGGYVDEKFGELRIKEELKQVNKEQFNQFTKENNIDITYEDVQKYLGWVDHIGLAVRVTGVLVIVIALIGILGAVFALCCLLLVYNCILKVILLVEIAIIVASIVMMENTYVKQVQNNDPFRELMKIYQWNNTFTHLPSVILEGIQYKMECCGDKSFGDYDTYRPVYANPVKLPYSCCDKYNKSSIERIIKNREAIISLVRRPENLNLTTKIENMAKAAIKEKTGIDLSDVQLINSDVNMEVLIDAFQTRNYTRLRPANLTSAQIIQKIEQARRNITKEQEELLIDTINQLTGIDLSKENYTVSLVNVLNMAPTGNAPRSVNFPRQFSRQLTFLFDEYQTQLAGQTTNATGIFNISLIDISRIDLSEYGLPPLNLSGVPLSSIKSFTVDDWMPLFGFNICTKTETVTKRGCREVTGYIFDTARKVIWWVWVTTFLHFTAIIMVYIIICLPGRNNRVPN